MQNGKFVSIRDLTAAEDNLLAALRASEEYDKNPDQWSGFESLSREGKKTLNLGAGHFDEADRRKRAVESARAALRALRTEWASYGTPPADSYTAGQ